MEYTSIRFSKTVQTAQFEPEVVEVHAVLDGEDNLQECAAKLRAEVTAALRGKSSGTTVTKKAATVEEPAEEETATKTTKKVAKKTTKKVVKKVSKKKDIPYDREVKAHKTDFGKILLEVAPTWQKDDDLKAKAKELSGSMAGKMMYSGEGEILASFKEEIEAGMTAGEDDL